MSDSLRSTDYTVYGILQARILGWVASPFSRGDRTQVSCIVGRFFFTNWATREAQEYWKVKVKSLGRVWLFGTPWTVAHQAPPSTGFSRQEYWSGVPFPSPGDLPDPGIEPRSPALWADAFNLWATREGLRILEWVAYPFSRGSSPPRNRTRVSALQADCLPTELNWEKGFVIAQQLKSLQIFLWLLLTTSRSPSAYSKDFADYRSNCFPSWYINLWSLINSLLQYVLLLFHYHTIFGAFLLACNTHTKSSCILNILGNGFPHNKHSWGSGTQAKQ